MQIRYFSGVTELAAAHASLKFRREVWAGDVNVRAIGMQIVFKSVRLDEITKRESGNKEEDADDMILYIENSKDTIRKLPEFINELGKVVRY